MLFEALFPPSGKHEKKYVFSVYICTVFHFFTLLVRPREHRQGYTIRDAVCMLGPGVISTKESRAFSLFVSHQVPTKCFFVREYWIHFILQAGPPSLPLSQFGLLGFQLRSGGVSIGMCIGTHPHNSPSKRNETKRTRTRILSVHSAVQRFLSWPLILRSSRTAPRRSIDCWLGGRWFLRC